MPTPGTPGVGGNPEQQVHGDASAARSGLVRPFVPYLSALVKASDILPQPLTVDFS